MDSEINLDASNVVVEYEKGKGSHEDAENGAGDGMTAIAAITGPLEGAIPPRGHAWNRRLEARSGR